MENAPGDIPQSLTPAALAPQSILVVDDEMAIQRLITRFLGQAGFHVETASGVDQALSAVSRNAFGLALCDMRMPGKSGYDFTREALKLDFSLPIVIMSGAVDEQVRAELIGEGACAVVEKPVQCSALLETVRTHLRGPQ